MFIVITDSSRHVRHGDATRRLFRSSALSLSLFTHSFSQSFTTHQPADMHDAFFQSVITRTYANETDRCDAFYPMRFATLISSRGISDRGLMEFHARLDSVPHRSMAPHYTDGIVVVVVFVVMIGQKLLFVRGWFTLTEWNWLELKKTNWQHTKVDKAGRLVAVDPMTVSWADTVVRTLRWHLLTIGIWSVGLDVVGYCR